MNGKRALACCTSFCSVLTIHQSAITLRFLQTGQKCNNNNNRYLKTFFSFLCKKKITKTQVMCNDIVQTIYVNWRKGFCAQNVWQYYSVLAFGANELSLSKLCDSVALSISLSFSGKFALAFQRMHLLKQWLLNIVLVEHLA